MPLARLILHHLRPYWGWVLAIVVLHLIATLAALLLPSLNAAIIDQGIAEGDVPFIWETGVRMLLVTLMQVSAAIGAVFCGARTAMSVGRDIRTRIYTQVNNLGSLDVSRFGAATLSTRGTNDVQQVQMLVLLTLNLMVTAPIMSIGGVVMALREDAGLAWLVWVAVPTLFLVVAILVKLLLPLFRAMQERLDDVNAVLREQILGIRVVRAFVREDYETDRYARANRALTDVSVRVGTIFVLMFPLIMVILQVATAAVLWFGGQRVETGDIEVGSLTAFMQYLLQILVAVMMGVFMVMMVPRAAVCAERIEEVITTEPSLPLGTGVSSDVAAMLRTPGSGTLEFTGVSFGYPGAEHDVVTDVSFTARPGETTAIIGSTGSGKSTLVRLASRMFDPGSGEITISGVPLTAFTPTDLAGIIAVVPQNPYLFSGTVASNLRFGNPGATDEELWDALRIAQGEDFVRDKPGELESPISQGGTNVSGGQRQRLSIARALVATPQVYLFDDSFSALDVTTDARVRAALKTATSRATTVIVAQRVSTIRHAEQIVVLDGGRVVGRGTHEELLSTCPTYVEIVESQAGADDPNVSAPAGPEPLANTPEEGGRP